MSGSEDAPKIVYVSIDASGVPLIKNCTLKLFIDIVEVLAAADIPRALIHGRDDGNIGIRIHILTSLAREEDLTTRLFLLSVPWKIFWKMTKYPLVASMNHSFPCLDLGDASRVFLLPPR